MNQIKYILSACLILLMISAFLFLYRSFPESGIIAQNQTTNGNLASKAVNANSKGQQLFKQNCASCHALDRDITGPALAEVLNRGPWVQDKNNIYAWVHNPSQFMTTDPYTQALRTRYGVLMSPFPNLSEKEIDEILDYIKSDANEVTRD